jgi:hypothetical protein
MIEKKKKKEKKCRRKNRLNFAIFAGTRISETETRTTLCNERVRAQLLETTRGLSKWRMGKAERVVTFIPDCKSKF